MSRSIIDGLTAKGWTVVDDPAQARPGVVYVDPLPRLDQRSICGWSSVWTVELAAQGIDYATAARDLRDRAVALIDDIIRIPGLNLDSVDAVQEDAGDLGVSIFYRYTIWE
jgi:hypothetical protein